MCPFGVRFGTVLERFWLVVGSFLIVLGPFWFVFAISGFVFVCLGSILVRLGSFLVCFGSFLVPSGGHIEEVKRVPSNVVVGLTWRLASQKAEVQSRLHVQAMTQLQEQLTELQLERSSTAGLPRKHLSQCRAQLRAALAEPIVVVLGATLGGLRRICLAAEQNIWSRQR